MTCYMCNSELEKDIYITSIDSNNVLFLCHKCEFLVKEIEGYKCDFCSSKKVSVIYKCPDIHQNVGDLPNIKVVSVNNWISCRDCEQVIDSKDLDSLIKRCMNVILNLSTDKDAIDYMVANMRDMYTMFLNRYTGKEEYRK